MDQTADLSHVFNGAVWNPSDIPVGEFDFAPVGGFVKDACLGSLVELEKDR